MSRTHMRAYAATAPGELQEIRLPIPEPDDYEVLVRHEGVLFCNTTDRMIIDQRFHTPSYPVVFGHESFGQVVKCGKKVTAFAIGDRVICSNAIIRGFDGTYHSTWGGFAEYGIAGDAAAYLRDGGSFEGENAYRRRYRHNQKIDPTLSIEQAGLAFSFAETASALRSLGPLDGKAVVVIGTGFVGYAFVCFAKALGASRVVCLGRREERLSVARALGADATFIDLSQAEADIRAHGGADLVLEASGNPHALAHGLPYLNDGGTLGLYAIPPLPYVFDLQSMPRDFQAKRLSPAVADALPWVCEQLRAEAIPYRHFLTHRWTFDEVKEAYAAVCRGEVIKGLITI